jgi:beta-galactosidase
MVAYWHWHTQHYGAEMYWGGILGHSLEPGRIYEELAVAAGELKRAGAVLDRLSPAADVAVLVSADSRWAMEFMGPLPGPTLSWTGDRQSYERILAAFYRGLFDAGLSADIVAPAQLPTDPGTAAARWQVLVVPGLYIADDALLDWLRRYADAGGHLVLSPRTGYATEDGVARPAVMPGLLRGAAGVSYLEYTNLARPVPVTGLAGSATAWADCLVPEAATSLAGYEHPHLEEYAAVTTNQHGAGRVTYVGTVPDRALSRAIAGWLASISLDSDPWRQAPESSVRCTAAATADGSVLRFVHNWSWTPAGLTVPREAADLLSGGELATGNTVQLGAWDVRVLVERT